jgi:hypothetical protein
MAQLDPYLAKGDDCLAAENRQRRISRSFHGLLHRTGDGAADFGR